MKVLGISGSPRKGNSEWMLNKLLEYMTAAGAEIEMLPLRKMDVRRCRGCLACEDRGNEGIGTCRIKDDMQDILPKIVSADAIVLATPAYFELLSGLLKNFLDRTCPIWPRLKGKQIAGLAVAEEGVGQAVSNIRAYGSVCGMRWVGGVSALAKSPCEVAQNKGVDARLKRLAKKFTL